MTDLLRPIFTVCSVIVATACYADTPSLLAKLTTTGTQIPVIGATPIESPALQAEQDAAMRATALKSIAGGAGWKRFSRNSVVAPVSIDLNYLKDAKGDRVGHLVHLAFVVHASLETLRDKDLMKQMFGDEKPEPETEAMESKEVSDKELARLGITKGENTSFAMVEIPLLDKVLARGVLKAQQTIASDSLTIAIEADPRFADRNSWARIVDDKSDKNATDGDWQPYQGAAGYLSVSRLNETDGKGLSSACLIESRFVIHEPADWFSGSNLLRSKLPLMLQESARSLRRKLK
jgi:hypothetical protein